LLHPNVDAEYVETHNPATGERLGRYQRLSFDDVARRLKRAHRTFREKWRTADFEERTGRLRELAKVLQKRKGEYARLMTQEMGKVISQSEAEVEKCAWTAEVYAEHSKEWLQEDLGSTDAQVSYVSFEPLGAILSVMPWNFPFWQVLRFAIPALVAGNTSVLRHSNVCAGSSLAVEAAFREAGFPDGAFGSIVTGHEVLPDAIASDYVQGVSFTGSVEAGQKIAEMAAKNLKKCVLELGGSDPFVVLEDADIGKAAEVGANARLICSGQSCIAAKRFIVVRPAAEEFTERFVREFEKKKVGDPMAHETDVGPLSSQQQVRIIESQVKDAVSKGARVLLGGSRRDGGGAFYEPTVLERVSMKMRVMREEVFGPVAPIYVVNDEDKAIEVANDSEYGLGASLWTSDFSKTKSLAARIQSGIVFVNAMVKSDPRMPFGGIKRSGIGRELSKYGLKEFVNAKSINVYGTDKVVGPGGGTVE